VWDVLRFLIALGLAVACGAPLVRGTRSSPLRGTRPALWRFTAARFVLAGALGLAVLTPVFLFIGLLGFPFRGRTFLLEAAASAFLLFRLRPELEWPEPSQRAEPRAWTVGSSLLLAAALALFSAKVTTFPVWSWDHWAVWGVRSRRMVTDGFLDLTFLRLPAFNFDYPLGVAVVWRYLGLGSIPGSFVVKATHLALAAGLTMIVREAVAEETDSPLAGNVAATFLVLSPLYWDTEAVGHMDLPLAFFLTAAVWLVLVASRADAPGRLLVRAGLLAGFLPWVKSREGFSLALLLAAATFALQWRRRGLREGSRAAAGILPGLALLFAGALFVHRFLPRGEHFAGGSWWERVSARLPLTERILGLLARCLISPDWMGLWVVFAAFAVAALWRRRWTSLTLSAVVAVELALYGAVYFVTYLDWYEHLRGSFCRISAALVPLAILAICARKEESAPPGS
jgi:hypothetical protein